ncbi:MAG: M23 family metallopeptidase [Bacteroidales bacterium]|nr:M23 family metallopeptidase [Bacteroidales bacterium]
MANRKNEILIAAAGLLVGYLITAVSPLRFTVRGYPGAEERQNAAVTQARVDSLESVIHLWGIYSENLKRVLKGEKTISLDSLEKRGNEYISGKSPAELMARDSILKATVADEDKFELRDRRQRELPIEGEHFIRPLKGSVSRGYESVLHPAVDITAPAGDLVKSVLDGTVIYTGWSDESGYTIVIQHHNDIISLYAHNQKLLKKKGDRVKAGSAIALVGNMGALTTDDHLRFELWYKGESVDPQKYIKF